MRSNECISSLHRYLGFPQKTRPRNDFLYVKWDVRLYTKLMVVIDDYISCKDFVNFYNELKLMILS